MPDLLDDLEKMLDLMVLFMPFSLLWTQGIPLSLLPARVLILLSKPGLLWLPCGEFSCLTGFESSSCVSLPCAFTTSDNNWHNGRIRKPLSNLLDFSSALFFSCHFLWYPALLCLLFLAWHFAGSKIYYWHSPAPPYLCPPLLNICYRTTSQDLRW